MKRIIGDHTALLVALMTGIAGLTAIATDYDDAADGNWSAPATWGQAVEYPDDASDRALINQTRTIDVDVSVTIDRLTVQGNALQTLNATVPNTLTISELISDNVNNFILGSGLTIEVTTTGDYNNRGGTIDGNLDVLSGAVLTYSFSQNQGGTGLISILAGGLLDLPTNKVISPSIDNLGQVQTTNNTPIFTGVSITGDGDWVILGTGTFLFNSSSMVIGLDPALAAFTAAGGTVKFDNLFNGTHTLGGFNMSGTNVVDFADGGSTYEINRASTFQDFQITASDTVDLAPLGTGGLTHTVNGTPASSATPCRP